MRDLLFSTRDRTLDEVMLRGAFALHAAMPMEDAMRLVLDRHYPVYPVVDAERRLIGLVRGQTMFEAQAYEISLQAGTMVGLEKEERLATPWARSLKLRHPWLQLNLLTAFLAAAVVGFFQDTIDRLVILALFLPVLAGQSGNTGCQALAVTLRSMTLGELKPGSERRLMAKETWVGCLNGIGVGIAAAVGMYITATSQSQAQPWMLGARRVPRDGGLVHGERHFRRHHPAHAEALRLRPGHRLEHLPHDRDRRREHGSATRARDHTGLKRSGHPLHSLRIDHLARHAAVDHEVLPGDEARGLRKQVGDELGDVLVAPDAADRVLSVVLLRTGWCAIQPGLTQFTRTSGPRLIASACVSPTSPALAAA